MTQQRKRRVVLDERGFRHGKQLLSAGIFSTSQIADILGVSISTVGRIRTAESLTDMRAKNIELVRRSQAKKQAVEQMPTFKQEEKLSEQPSSEPQPQASGKPTVNQPTKQDLLNDQMQFNVARIADALERLADACEKQSEKKKGIFGK